eukprot:GEMP01108311.1.p1 GENE.GEMP01108311.1~~GEMP01108311.1.p1  ORF type:complete len:197 (-),score=8.12 GEMP01108311.1:50-640(-)
MQCELVLFTRGLKKQTRVDIYTHLQVYIRCIHIYINFIYKHLTSLSLSMPCTPVTCSRTTEQPRYVFSHRRGRATSETRIFFLSGIHVKPRGHSSPFAEVTSINLPEISLVLQKMRVRDVAECTVFVPLRRPVVHSIGYPHSRVAEQPVRISVHLTVRTVTYLGDAAHTKNQPLRKNYQINLRTIKNCHRGTEGNK